MTIPTIGFSDNTLATDDVPDLHHFAVLATDSAGDTYLSNIQTADYSVPRYPADLAATALADGNIGVTWSNSAFNESGGILKRSLDDGATWTSIASLSTDQTTFLDTTAPAGVDVLYEAEYTRTNDSGLAESGYDVMTTPVAIPGLQAHILSLDTRHSTLRVARGGNLVIALTDTFGRTGKPVTSEDVETGGSGSTVGTDSQTTNASGRATLTLHVSTTGVTGPLMITITDGDGFTLKVHVTIDP